MKPEKWAKIEATYHAALAIDPARRAAYLTESCGVDEGLRSEVEELLEFDSRAGGFIETPALHVLARQEARALDASSGFRLAAGAQLGPYEILNPLGAGGMGEIYSARDTRLGRTVAVKILTARMTEQPGFRERLEREARAISSLNHPHICTLHDIGRDQGIDYLVMEFVEGQSLAERLKNGPLPGPDVLRIAIEIAGALAYAHRQGVIHRDLKPGNIMLTSRGAKLVDFGLARWRDIDDDGTGTGGDSEDPSRTEAGAVLGTPQYMAPEQAGLGRVDARTDIFSLGAVIFEMSSGRKALEGAAEANAKIPAALRPAVARCLKIAPEERWQSARDLIVELNRIGRDGAGTRTKVRRWMAAGAAATFLAAGAWVLRETRRPSITEQVLHSFTGQDGDGASSFGGVVEGKNGRLYGVTQHGGWYGKGTVYELRQPWSHGNEWAETVLYSFTGAADGTEPLPSLIMGANGSLYGVTQMGGEFKKGTVFELTPPAAPGGIWTERVLHNFSRRNGDGTDPRPDLTIGKDESLYSTTVYGGSPAEEGYGIVYRLTPPADPRGAWQENVLYRFKGVNGDGSCPYGNVVLGADGAVYGTTFSGTAGRGIVYRLTPSAVSGAEWTETILHTFTGENGDGRAPVGDMAFGPGGALYGTTLWGGISGNGTVFELRPAESAAGGWTYSVVHRFTSQIGDGAEPSAGLLVGEDGSFYGATVKGGAWGNGTVFRLTPSRGAWIETVLYSFTGNNGDGSAPECIGRLLLDHGSLYGTTHFGGTSNVGTVFRLTLR